MSRVTTMMSLTVLAIREGCLRAVGLGARRVLISLWGTLGSGHGLGGPQVVTPAWTVHV